MLYKFDFLINTASKNKLFGFMGKRLDRIITEVVEEFVTKVILENQEIRIQISNTVGTQSDGDEYSKFNIKEGEYLQDFVFDEVGEFVREIQIVTDEVEWTTNESVWRIRADVAIIIGMKDSRFLIQLVDSLAGFMKCYRNDDCIKLLSDIDVQWSMKADKLSQSKRTIVSL